MLQNHAGIPWINTPSESNVSLEFNYSEESSVIHEDVIVILYWNYSVVIKRLLGGERYLRLIFVITYVREIHIEILVDLQ